MTATIPFLGFDEPFSSWSHFLAAAVFFVASFFLIYRGRGHPGRVAALALYSFTIVFLLSMSATYHLLSVGSTARNVLQRLDHVGIWLLIAGTFTPLHIIGFVGPWRWAILLLIWVVAITILVFETIFFSTFPEWLSLSCYLLLGWVGLLSAVKYWQVHRGTNISYLLLGGVCYSLGAICDFLRWPTLIPGVVGPHEWFHIFVLLGVYYHWRLIYSISDLAISKQLTFLVKVRSKEAFFARAMSENIQIFAQTEEELRTKIFSEIEKKYRPYRLPDAVRIQYIQEEFWSPASGTMTSTIGHVFYRDVKMKKRNAPK